MRFQSTIPILAILLLIAAGGIWVVHLRRADTTTKAAVDQPGQHPRVRLPLDTVDVQPESHEPGWFTTITASTGIDFQHNSGANAEKPFPAANGSGLAALDYDLDGLYDLYFATGTPFPLKDGRTTPINRCYRNLGSARFEEVTRQCGLDHNGYSAGLAIGDYDGDGFPDVYVNCFGSNVLYHNLGDGHFEAVTQAAQVDDERWGTSAAFFDYDEDGLLDLYVCNYAKWTWETRRWCGDRKRNARVYCGPHSVEPVDDVLFQNRGDGTFDDVTLATGLGGRSGRAQGVIAADLNRDGHCDLYIGNDLNANSLFVNSGNGMFNDETELSGVAYDYKGSVQAGMGVDAADVTGDGLPELFVTNFSNEHNSFYLNMSDGFFQESSQQIGLYSQGYPWVGWGTAFADFDLDGRLDLVVTNGHVDDNRHLFGEDAPYAEPPLAWRKNDERFEFLGAQAGDYFTKSHVGRALVVLDLDNDGDQDLVMGHQDTAPAVLQNNRLTDEAPTPASYSLRLVGTRNNRDAIGAAITMRWNDQMLLQQVKGGGSYLSGHDPRKIFAVPMDAEKVRFEIQWPGGDISVIDDLRPGSTSVIVEPLGAGGTPQTFSLK
jgi:hypothetical protein